MLHLVVNQQKWNELPKSYQAILFQRLRGGEQLDAGEVRRRQWPAPAPHGRRAASEVRTFSPPIMEASLKAANELYAELSAKNAGLQEGLQFDGRLSRRRPALVAASTNTPTTPS